MLKNETYLKWVREQPCLVCHTPGVDAHHPRSITGEKRGFSQKACGDDWAVPICRPHHIEAHSFGNEVDYWIEKRVDPIDWASKSYQQWTKWKQKTSQ